MRMTEKRFELKWRDTGEVLYDNENELEHGIYSPDYRFHVRDMMNEFDKENKELKKENEQLKSKYSEQCIQNDFLKNQHMRDLVKEIKQLKEENYELKQGIIDYSHYLTDKSTKLEEENKELKDLIGEMLEDCVIPYPLRVKLEKVICNE